MYVYLRDGAPDGHSFGPPFSTAHFSSSSSPFPFSLCSHARLKISHFWHIPPPPSQTHPCYPAQKSLPRLSNFNASKEKLVDGPLGPITSRKEGIEGGGKKSPRCKAVGSNIWSNLICWPPHSSSFFGTACVASFQREGHPQAKRPGCLRRVVVESDEARESFAPPTPTRIEFTPRVLPPPLHCPFFHIHRKFVSAPGIFPVAMIPTARLAAIFTHLLGHQKSWPICAHILLYIFSATTFFCSHDFRLGGLAKNVPNIGPILTPFPHFRDLATHRFVPLF